MITAVLHTRVYGRSCYRGPLPRVRNALGDEGDLHPDYWRDPELVLRAVEKLMQEMAAACVWA
jgi:ABC-type Zn uptake system ZnuABC Zn-binding protein ZnuA